MHWQGSARSWMSLLFHGSKVVDVLEAALELGILDELDRGPVTLGSLSERIGAAPGRLSKFLDCLESVGLIERVTTEDDPTRTSYRSVEPLKQAALLVVGPESIERDRDRHPWRMIAGRLSEVLRGEHGISPEAFTWPPQTPEQISSFETSMALGCRPIAESFLENKTLFERLDERGRPVGVRALDVGGGDGTLAATMLPQCSNLSMDVYNLASVAPLVSQKIEEAGLASRMNFVPGDFLNDELPSGYDVLSFVRVLHDWPDSVARTLIAKAHRALRPGARLIISEEFRNPDRLAVQFFWSYFLIGLDQCVSRLRDAAFYVDALRQSGFLDIRVIEGTFDIVTAVRA